MTNLPLNFAKAIADETRQKIMEQLCCRWLNVTEIVETIGNVTQPTISHHLAVLRDAGLVDAREEGKHTYYTLNQDSIAVCCGRLIQVFAPETELAKAVDEAHK
ncbi:MAG: ArsR family transcriptional regulator [Chloroflexi bacterium]|nr:MAG: ArsR family transcriptional regulator [Chloroflexota bacterium]